MVSDVIPPRNPTFMVNNFDVVHIQHLVLLGNTHMNRQCTITVFSAISRMLTKGIEGSSISHLHSQPLPSIVVRCPTDGPLTLHDTIVTHIYKIPLCGKLWICEQHVTKISAQFYVKIKSHQLHSNGYTKYYARPQSYIALVSVTTERTRPVNYQI